jgi:hypothetical protein
VTDAGSDPLPIPVRVLTFGCCRRACLQSRRLDNSVMDHPNIFLAKRSPWL